MLAMVFAGQIILIFGLSDRAPLQKRPPARAPVLQFVGDASSELLALLDPTLFALPHRQGFSAQAWRISRPSPETPSASPAEPPEYLALPIPQPGAGFDRFVAANRFALAPPRSESAPDLALPNLFSSPLPTAPSTVRIEGVLAQRKLLQPFNVPSWPHTEILSNTVVQIVVDTAGRTVSPGALLTGSGLKEADQFALKLARAAHFQPLVASDRIQASDHTGPLTWGRLVFEWQTVPVVETATNAPSSQP
jgi:hypothetical protein